MDRNKITERTEKKGNIGNILRNKTLQSRA